MIYVMFFIVSAVVGSLATLKIQGYFANKVVETQTPIVVVPQEPKPPVA